MSIAVIDTAGANLVSVTNALERLGVAWQLTADPERIVRARAVILPGVGAAAHAMDRLHKANLVSVIRGLGQPVLGICLGMQLLFSASDEGDATCLNLIGTTEKVRRLEATPSVTVPHMGWNRVEPTGAATPLLRGIRPGSYFYFVHSYVAPGGPWVRATSQHGVVFPAVVEKDNFFGCQFHPERSAEAGAQLLRNFVAL